MVETYDAVVVGGGPAGLIAALELAQAGATVAVVDEASELGGQYYKRRHEGVLRQYGDYRRLGTALIARVHAAGVTCLTQTLVWGAEQGTLLTIRMPDAVIGRITGRCTLVATGAFEKSVPFPGWTLPGVCTPGCALHFATMDRVAVGSRVLVAGTGPFLLPVASALLELGAQVLGVLELNHPYSFSRAGLRAARHPARLRELAGYLARLAWHRVPLRQGWQVLSASGSSRVERVHIVQLRAGRVYRREELSVDALCVAYGFRPNAELLRLLGVQCTADPASGDLVPVTDEFGKTSHPAIYAAGEARGIGGVHAAMSQGRLAAYGIARDLGLRRPATGAVNRVRRQAARTRDFASLTAEMFPVPVDIYRAIPDETVICRCEGVRAGEVRVAARLGWNDLNSTKGLTRAGMGPCQGRECGNTVAALVGGIAGTSPSEEFSSRIPIKPIPLWPLADDTATASHRG